ncbi:unnamed protein product [Pleuronectes platessa]|uniref:Glucuronosyltransferase n=1 Tax=Pleuronectes platessa TaxID=8262 RepID=A0A9N7Y9B9_PLEPL|nr:unnamed protein product [Pleuronectes platessa]
MRLEDPAIGGGVLLGHRLGLPLVFNVRWTIQGEGHQAIAPSPVSYVPIQESELTDKMTFNQRVKNFLFYLFTRFQVWYTVDSNYKPFVQRHFGSDVHYMELFQAADIWLMRNDFTFEFPRPTMPNIIYMSGFQCKPSKPLSKDLEEFVQSSGEHGVIVMTLGTLVANLPEDVTDHIAAAFAKLPQKNDLLGHPKTRLFVAHGGTNGIQEAVYHGVPLVGLPLLFDQHDNFFKMKVRGVAKVMDIATVNRENFLEALEEVLYEPSYRENMRKLSNLQRDQPIKPLDHAVFWIEFVMRHKGAPHLRTESYKMSLVQYYSIDVIGCLLAVGHGENVYRLPTDCLQTANRLPTDFTQTAYRPPTDYLQTPYRLSTDCLQTAYRLPTDCLQTAYRLPTDCLQTAYRLPTDCLQTLDRLPTDCLQTIFRVSTDFRQTSYRLPTDCLQTTYRLSTDCLQTIYRLHTDFRQTVYRLPTHFRQTAYRLSTDGLQTVYRLPCGRSVLVLFAF